VKQEEARKRMRLDRIRRQEAMKGPDAVQPKKFGRESTANDWEKQQELKKIQLIRDLQKR
jgi:hypothetical protein